MPRLNPLELFDLSSPFYQVSDHAVSSKCTSQCAYDSKWTQAAAAPYVSQDFALSEIASLPAKRAQRRRARWKHPNKGGERSEEENTKKIYIYIQAYPSSWGKAPRWTHVFARRERRRLCAILKGGNLECLLLFEKKNKVNTCRRAPKRRRRSCTRSPWRRPLRRRASLCETALNKTATFQDPSCVFSFPDDVRRRTPQERPRVR